MKTGMQKLVEETQRKLEEKHPHLFFRFTMWMGGPGEGVVSFEYVFKAYEDESFKQFNRVDSIDHDRSWHKAIERLCSDALDMPKDDSLIPPIFKVGQVWYDSEEDIEWTLFEKTSYGAWRCRSDHGHRLLAYPRAMLEWKRIDYAN